MQNIVLQVSPDLADKLRHGDAPEAAELRRTLRACGAELGRPTGDAGETALYYQVDGVAPEDAAHVLERLRRVPGVEAAYAKPQDEPP